MNPEQVDVLIVTALQLERSAIRSHLTHHESLTIEPLVLDIGRFSAESRQTTVAILEVGPGNIDAAVLTTLATTRLQPRVTLMVGIGGGIKDVEIGDVVASSKVYWLESGKSVENHVASRPDFGSVSAHLIQVARQVAIEETWQGRIQHETAARVPKALVAPFVVGERVVASTLSADARRIRSDYSDAVVVAMEDIGVTVAAAIAGSAQALAIRSISDLVDGKSEADAEGGQPLAAANAAAFAFEVLARVGAGAGAASIPEITLHELASELYPTGPTEQSVWERAGGDLAQLSLSGTGRSKWWGALRALNFGGGGDAIDLTSLLEIMTGDFPSNATLPKLASTNASIQTER